MGNPATFAWRSRQDRRRAERDSLARLGEQASAGVAEGSAAGLARARALTNVTQRGERAQEYKAAERAAAGGAFAAAGSV